MREFFDCGYPDPGECLELGTVADGVELVALPADPDEKVAWAAAVEGQWNNILLASAAGEWADEALLWRQAGRTAGAATLSPPKGDRPAEIPGVFVRGPYRGQGRGRQLLEAAIERLVERGYRRVRLAVATAGGRRTVASVRARRPEWGGLLVVEEAGQETG